MPDPGRRMTVLAVAGGVPSAVLLWNRLTGERHLAVPAVTAAALAVVGVLWAKVLAPVADHLLARVRDVLDQTLDREVTSYGGRYRRAITESQPPSLVVDGLDLGADRAPRLDEVYVEVAVAGSPAHAVSGDLLAGLGTGRAARHRPGQPQPIGHFLERVAVIGVLGAPGTGKSTLLQHLARRAAAAPWRARWRFPVEARLRDHAAAVLADPELDLACVVRAVALRRTPKDAPAGWWELQLARGHCLLLLDGLDEVPREQDRRLLTDWLRRQVERYPGNRFVVTSRPGGHDRWDSLSAQVVQMCPLTWLQVQRFVHRWYAAVEGAGDDGQRARAGAEALTALLGTARLQDLTVNPLLLTMIANVYRYDRTLPDTLVGLYERICRVMLGRRIPEEDRARLVPLRLELLDTLAFTMMSERLAALPRVRALDTLRREAGGPSAPITAEEFLNSVRCDGLLVEEAGWPLPDEGEHHVALPHLTFQEYLAARHIRRRRLGDVVLAAVDEPWWHRTAVFYAEFPGAGDAVVEACLASRSPAALALAFECVTSQAVAPGLRERIDALLAAAFRPGCTREYRHLVAGALADQLSRTAIAAGPASRVCTALVPARLYQLFVTDTRAPLPDLWAPDSHEAAPVLGVWRDQAEAFVAWLNRIAGGGLPTRFRLPRAEELDVPAVRGALLGDRSGMTCVWTSTDGGGPARWVPPGRPDPHVVTGAQLRQAVTADATRQLILLNLVTATAGVAARHRVIDLDRGERARQLGGLAFAPRPSDRRPFDRDAATARALARAVALDPGLATALGLDAARGPLHPGADQGPMPRSGRREDVDRALAALLALAHDLAEDLDPELAGDLAGLRDDALDRLDRRDPDRATDRTLDRLLGRVLDQVAAPAMASAVGGPLAAAGCAAVRAAGAGRASLPAVRAAFAAALTSAAGVAESTCVAASPDALPAVLQAACAAVDRTDRPATPCWRQRLAADHLLSGVQEILDRPGHRPARAVAGVRAAALALAAPSPRGAVSPFVMAAAAVTLLERRAEGVAPIGEAVVLALE